MVYIEKFFGKKVEIPEDRRYYIKQGLWAAPEGEEIVFGLSEPALMLIGGLNSMDWLVPDGNTVQQGETVIFAITGKIMYIDAPVGGMIYFNDFAKENPSVILQDPYSRGWVFKIRPEIGVKETLMTLSDANQYAESLKTSEGCKNPDGLKGGMSSICKAVYSGIRGQNL